MKDIKLPRHARLQPPAFQPTPSQIESAAPKSNAARVAAAGSRQNLYVAGKDQDVWNRAEKLGEPESMSSLVVRLLRRFVLQREAAQERIVVDVTDHDGNTMRKGFKGRMLVSGFQDSRGPAGTQYHAAQGANGGLALWWTNRDDEARGFMTYESWDELVDRIDPDEGDDAMWSQELLSVISAALGEEYIEEIHL
jgi:hypothetical protein